MRKVLKFAACMLMLASCDEHSSNDDQEGPDAPEIAQKETVEYTLTADDYKAIASNAVNVDLAGSALAEALADVGMRCRFTKQVPAEIFVPAFLNTTDWPYHALGDGRAVLLTYNIAADMPPEVLAINAAKVYTVTGDDYRTVWESDDNYISAFAPVKPASKSIPDILAAQYPEAVSGDYVVVNYNESAVDPIFGNNGGGDAPQPGNPYDFKPATVVVAGRTYMFYVASAGLCAAPLLKNKIYGYLPVASVTPDSAGMIAQENAQNGFVFESADGGGYYMKDVYGRYLYMSGSYNSFSMATSLPDDKSGYIWSVAVTDGGVASVTNVEKGKSVQYDALFDSWGAYSDTRGLHPTLYVMTGSDNEPVAASMSRAPVSEPVAMAMTGVYCFNGSKWSEPAHMLVINPDEYQAITGAAYGALSVDQVETLLPIYLKASLPYAGTDDRLFIVYKAYQGITPYTCTQFMFDGEKWVPTISVEAVTGRFVRGNGSWRKAADQG